MIYLKLAARNLSRSLKDYAIYFFTVAVSVVIFYAFNSLQDQPVIVEMCRQAGFPSRNLGLLLGSISVFVSFVVAALVLYSNNFIIRRRKRELGTYLLLGMSQKTVGLMLFVETCALGLVACLCGIVAGVFFSGVFSIFFSLIMQVPVSTAHFSLSADSALLTLVFYGLIFLGVGLTGSITISRYTLVSLLASNRANEIYRARRRWVTAVFGTLSLGILAFGYYLAVSEITSPSFNPFSPVYFLVAFLVTIGSLGFFYAAIGLGMGLLRRLEQVSWNGLNIFTIRQVVKKVNSNTLVLTATNLLLAITITSLGMLVFIKTLFNQAADPDLQISYVLRDLSPADSLAEIDRAARSNSHNPLLKEIVFTGYTSGVDPNSLLLPDDRAANESALWAPHGNCTALGVTAYNQLRETRALAPVALTADEIAVQIGSFSSGYADQVNRSVRRGLSIPFQNKTYTVRQVFVESFGDLLHSTCGLVVPDALTGGLSPQDGVTIVGLRYANSQDAQLEESLGAALHDLDHGFLISAQEQRASLQIVQTIGTFSGLYLETILLMACASVLGLQQLIEAIESARHYQTLRHLGADESDVRRSIFRQVTFYFLAPVGLAIVHSLFALGAFNKAFGGFVALSPWALLGALAFLLAVYGSYYLITWRTCLSLTRASERSAPVD